jgi:hypothetical protein
MLHVLCMITALDLGVHATHRLLIQHILDMRRQSRRQWRPLPPLPLLIIQMVLPVLQLLFLLRQIPITPHT